MKTAGRLQAGYSLVEIIVTITIIGILSFIALPMMPEVLGGVSRSTATRNLDLLNGAVTAFNQAAWELSLASSSAITDEQAIYNSLRYRDTAAPIPGSPFLGDRVAFVASSDTTTYRARWTGRRFEILMPGTSGTGMDLLRMQASETQPTVTNTPIPPS